MPRRYGTVACVIYRLDRGSYGKVRRFASESRGEAEYYHALLDGRQTGKVFVDNTENPAAVLFWHYCGYGFAAGEINAEFSREILAMVRQQHPLFTGNTELKHRFILQQDDPTSGRMLENAEGVFRSERLCFVYERGNACTASPSLPDGFVLKSVNAEILPLLVGEVNPAFSWQSDEDFLRGGVAVCVMHGGEAAAWAFSGAVGGGRMDIGVETAEPYRGHGLARAAANALAEAALGMNYTPVWGCDASNIASARTAVSAGFIPCCRHAKFKKAAV